MASEAVDNDVRATSKKNRLLGIQSKVLLLLALTLLVSAGISAYNFVSIEKLKQSSDLVINNDVPILRAIEGALSPMASYQLAVEKLLDSDNLSAVDDASVKAELDALKARFSMYIEALTWGTNSEAFLSADGGEVAQLWKESVGQSFVVDHPSPEIAQVAGQTGIYFEGFINHVDAAIIARKRYLQLKEGAIGESVDALHVSREEILKARVFSGYITTNFGLITNISALSITSRSREVTVSQQQARRGIIFAGLIGFVLSMLTGVVFAKYLLIYPIDSLLRSVSTFKHGNLSSRTHINTGDEIETLSEEFNHMADELSSYARKLEDEVADRKKEFEEKIRDHESSKAAFGNLLEDVSQSKKISDEHAEELKKFQLAVENTSQHVIITDAQSNILYANEAVVHTTGYSRDELIGNKPSLWGGQMPKEFFDEMWNTIMVEKQDYRGELQNKRKNGEIYTASTIISPIVDSSGEVKFFIGLETDISKQKALENALKKEKEMVEAIVVQRTRELNEEKARLLASINSLSFGFIIADANDRVVLTNKAMGNLFGLATGDIVVIDTVAALLGEHFDLKMQIKRCFEDRAVCEIKEIIFGSKFLRGIIAPILVEESTDDIGYVLLLEDVTDARAQERSRDEFFSIASHELRTPLTAIRGNASMLKDFYGDKMPDEDMKEMVSDILVSSERLINIVNDFLAVSRLEQKRLEFKKEAFDVAVIIKNVITELATIANAHNLELRFEEPAYTIPDILAAKDRVKQVVLNLISNALNYTEKGSVTVSVVERDGFVKVSVKDTGVGIAPQYQSLLFRKFQQAGDQILTRGSSQGTGLGLYISKLMVEAMGGVIVLEESEHGKGSTFSFTLPVAPKSPEGKL